MSGADSSIRATIDSSTIEWNGHVDSSSMFGTLQRFALSSCGISLHSNTEYGGLVTFDKEIEKHLSPALTGSPARHIRCLTRDIIRSQVGRRALTESLGILIDSLAAEALFGDPSEYPAGVILDFERSIAAISSTISNGGFPTDIIPLPSSAVKSERRRLVDSSAFGEPGADRLDDAEGQPGDGDRTSGGGVLPPTSARRAQEAITQGTERYRPDYRPLRMPLLALYAGQSPLERLWPRIPAAQQRQARGCAKANARWLQAAGPDDLRAQRPDATIEIWPDASHHLFLEHPQRTADAIQGFVAGLAPAAP